MSPPRLFLPLLACLLGGCRVIPTFSVTPRVGPRSIDGDFLVTSGTSSGGSDAETLGFEEDPIGFAPRLDASWANMDLMATASHSIFEGTGRAENQLDLGGVIIAAGNRVDSKLDLQTQMALLTFDLIPTGLVDVGIGLGATLIDFEADLRDLDTGEQIGSTQSFGLPLGALRIGSRLGPIDVNAHWGGLAGEYNDVDGEIHDIDVFGRYEFTDFLGFEGGLVLGYRMYIVDVMYQEDGSDVEADFSINGPYIGLSLRR